MFKVKFPVLLNLNHFVRSKEMKCFAASLYVIIIILSNEEFTIYTIKFLFDSVVLQMKTQLECNGNDKF